MADKNCQKIHFMAPNMYCCGAGTAADTENVTGQIASQLELHRLATGRQSRVGTAHQLLKSMLYKYQGYVSAALVLAGIDPTGVHLYSIYPHGSTDKLPYATMGSGSLAAMSIFEQGYRDGLSEQEAKDLAHAAISAGIFNDLGSGSNVDLCVIRRNPDSKEVEVEYLRNMDMPNNRKRMPNFSVPAGATAVLEVRERFHRAVVVSDGAPDEMQVA